MLIPDVLIGTFQISNQDEMDAVVRTAVRLGAYGFDTAPSYGTESMLGKSIGTVISNGLVRREDLFIQDKIDAMQMYWYWRRGIKKFVRKQLEKLKVTYLDVLLVHWPFRQYFNETWREMVSLKEEGYVKRIGVCNLDIRGFDLIFKEQDSSCIDIIQNEIHPLNTDFENTRFFQEKGFIVEAYSPLCRMNTALKEDAGMQKIAGRHHVDIGRVILKWHIQRGIHPVFTTRKRERLQSNLDLRFTLNENEMTYINAMNRDYKIFPISHGCPGY